MTPNIAIVHVHYPHGPEFPALAAAVSAVDSGNSAVAVHSSGSAGRLSAWQECQLLAVDRHILGDPVQLAGNGCTGLQPRAITSSFGFCRGCHEHRSPRHFSLVAMGRITAARGGTPAGCLERQPRDSMDSRCSCLAFACLAQLHLRELLPMLMHFFNALVPALAEAVHHALSPITELLGGLL